MTMLFPDYTSPHFINDMLKTVQFESVYVYFGSELKISNYFGTIYTEEYV